MDFCWKLSTSFERGLWLLHPGIARVGGAGPCLAAGSWSEEALRDAADEGCVHKEIRPCINGDQDYK